MFAACWPKSEVFPNGFVYAESKSLPGLFLAAMQSNIVWLVSISWQSNTTKYFVIIYLFIYLTLNTYSKLGIFLDNTTVHWNRPTDELNLKLCIGSDELVHSVNFSIHNDVMNSLFHAFFSVCQWQQQSSIWPSLSLMGYQPLRCSEPSGSCCCWAPSTVRLSPPGHQSLPPVVGGRDAGNCGKRGGGSLIWVYK